MADRQPLLSHLFYHPANNTPFVVKKLASPKDQHLLSHTTRSLTLLLPKIGWTVRYLLLALVSWLAAVNM
jgi:hypothetical protein